MRNRIFNRFAAWVVGDPIGARRSFTVAMNADGDGDGGADGDEAEADERFGGSGCRCR